jgi:hypothetical protein
MEKVMKIQIEKKDRFNVWVKTDANKIVRIQRYPMSQHAAWKQIELYQNELKGRKIGETIDITWNDYIRTIERAVERQ